MAVYRGAREHEIGRILATPGIREAIAVPRASPRAVREALAAILAEELVLGEAWETRDRDQAIRRLGPAFYILNAARSTEAWERLKALSARNRVIALLCLSSALEALLDTVDEVSCGRFPRTGVESVFAFEALIAETLSLWGRKPGSLPAANVSRLELHALEEIDALVESVGLIHQIVRQTLTPRLIASLDEISESVDAIEIASLLSSGRGWDYALTDLRQDDIRDIKRYSDLVRRNQDLAAMIDDLGRASAGSAPDGSRVLQSGKAEVHSIVTSSDLPYVLPSELVKLREDVLKYLFFARWAEGKLLTYQLKDRGAASTESKHRKGPVVALVDTSGSMDGAPGIVAKAIVLAAARKFLREGRPMRIVLFSSVGQAAEIDLSHGHMSTFMDFLRSSFGGGTDFDTALRTGLGALAKTSLRYADLLFVTDGMSQVTDQGLIDDWDRLKKARGNQIFSIIVGNDQAGGLEAISDRIYLFGPKAVNKSIGTFKPGAL